MTQIKVIILAGGKMAKEANPTEKPEFNYEFGPDGPTASQLESAELDHDKRFDQWQAAEDRLRTFEIDNPPINVEDMMENKYIEYNIYNVGKEYRANILDDGRVKIQ